MTSKPVDRFPIICPAGKTKCCPDTVQSRFKDYPEDELAQILIQQKENPVRKFSTKIEFQKPSDNLDALFKQDLEKTRFEAFEESFYEDLYYRRAPLGQSVDAHSKPKCTSNENTIFGRPYVRSESLYDLILPNRKADDVWTDHAKWHDKYVYSHGSYWPSERINRKYKAPFESDTTFGEILNVDVTGINVKGAMQDFKRCDDEPLPVINKTLAEYLETQRSPLGKPLKRQKLSLPADKFFGHIQRPDKYSAKELIQNTERCLPARRLFDSLSHVNKVRRKLFNDPNFYFHDLLTILQKEDVKTTGYLPWSTVFENARSLYAYMDEEKVKYLAKYYKYTNEDNTEVKYNLLLELLDIGYPLPELGRIYPTTKVMTTTYREFANDLRYSPTGCNLDAAGRVCGQYPRNMGVKVDMEHLGEETSVRALISPNVPTQFGLNHRDFLLPRSKPDIRKLFTRAGWQFKNETDFDEIWNDASKQWSSVGDMVSIDAFKYAIGQFIEKRKN